MANNKSAEKRILQNETRYEINRARVSRIRTYLRKVEEAIATGNKTVASEAFKVTQPELHIAVKKGIMQKNTVARKLSRLSARIKALA